MLQAITDATPERELLAHGRCSVGVDKVEITPEGRHPLAGFSWSGSWGRPGRDRLWARALYVEDIETGQRVVICIVDLLSGTNALLDAVERALVAGGHEELVGRVIVSGTHTHTAPGRFFGNRFYDRLAAPFALRRHDASLTRELGEKVARACIGAARQRARGDLCVLRAPVWGAARNRSIAAHRANAADPERPDNPWRTPAAGLTEEEAAVDPRVTLWCARAGEQLVGAFAWFGCHGTALGQKFPFYHRDWLGISVDAVEAAFDGVLCAVGSGASGDVTPLPSPSAPAPLAGEALARHVGLRVGNAIGEMLRALPQPCDARLRLTLDSGVFEVAADGSTPRWQVGVPVLGGSEDGGPSYRKLQFVAEGFRGDSGAQRPKAPALGLLQALTLGPLDMAHHHPWYRLRLGDHVHCTVPGEPTVMAALTLEQRAREQLGASSVSVVGYSGDYCGYFTTQPEYDQQHYEGASTLYGPRSLEWYRDQLLGPSRPRPRASDVARPPPADSAPPSGAVPRRNVQRLLSVAHELPARDAAVDLLFAVPKAEADAGSTEASGRASALPRVRVVPLDGDASQGVEGVSRPFANPDPEGARELDTCVAVFERARLEAAGLTALERARLEVQHAGVERRHTIVSHARAESEGRLPAPAPGHGPLGRVRRSLLGLGLLFTSLALVLLAIPGWVLAALGWAAAASASGAAPDVAAFPELMARNVGLTFLLLGLNLLIAKNSPDRRALSGYAYASALLSLSLAVFAYRAQHTELVAAIFIAAALGLGAFGFGIRPVLGRAATASHAHWEFWAPLFWLGLLTLLVGGFLLLLPAWFARWFGIRHPDADAWLRLYGAGFWVNTVSMWRSQYTRDLRVVSAQLWASLAFDSLSPVLLAIAIACQVLNPWGLLLLPPFLGIVAYMRHMQGLAARHARREIEKPRTTGELRRIIRDAGSGKKLVRVLGSGHSAPPAIFGDAEPQPRGRRPSRERCVHISLDHLDRVLDVDRARRRISVQAGMRIGVDPGHEPSTHHNLLAHLRALGWALGDLGGIVHQTIGGFLATGSSGGSVTHALHEGIVELRFVDAKGDVRVARRDAGGPERELFDALSVSMGLLGVVTEVSFECEAAYQVEGREFTARVVDGVAELPRDAATGAAARQLDLRAPGEGGVAAYLREPGYKRILWWPQAAISALVVWEGHRTDVVAVNPRAYQAPQGVLQFIAGRVLELLGWSYGVGNPSIIGNWLRRKILPPFARQFMPKKPVLFHAPWDDNLPMDTHVDEAFLPVEFTELWFDLDRSHEVMSTLLDMYRADEDLAGTFTVELYASRGSEAWLSPSYGRDSFRVDIFWYQRNAGDPVTDYYPRFFARLEPFAFRAHWGKYLPQPGPQCAEYFAQQFPRWTQFLELRRALDPKGLFLSTYWRRHLGVD